MQNVKSFRREIYYFFSNILGWTLNFTFDFTEILFLIFMFSLEHQHVYNMLRAAVVVTSNNMLKI